MPIHYHIARTRVIEGRAEPRSSGSVHYQIHARTIYQGAVRDFRIAVNALSSSPAGGSAESAHVQFVIDEHLQHPITHALQEHFQNLTPVLDPSGPDADFYLQNHATVVEPTGPDELRSIRLDYIRSNLFDRSQMTTLPPYLPGRDDDLQDRLDQLCRRAVQQEGAWMYVFGDLWTPNPKADKDRPAKFDFEKDLTHRYGMHDIHMNQGNPVRSSFARDNGVYQDGGLIFHFPAAAGQPEQWVGVFLAFQTQAWHTDDRTGHPLLDEHQSGPADHPSATEPDFTVRIVAALVDPFGGEPEAETVTLLNTSEKNIALQGWKLLDQADHASPLSGTLAAGEALRVKIKKPMSLGNQGGTITLLNASGLKVDGVSYSAREVKPGRTLKF